MTGPSNRDNFTASDGLAIRAGATTIPAPRWATPGAGGPALATGAPFMPGGVFSLEELAAAPTPIFDAMQANAAALAEEKTAWQHPTRKAPESVMLVGLGPSKYELTEGMVSHDYTPEWSELWTVNKGIALFPRADVAFIMDDVHEYAGKHPAYGAEMRRYTEGGGHIIGQTTIPNDGGIPFHEYPLQDVIRAWGGTAQFWLHTISIGYVLAYAGYVGVKRLLLAGIDCSWPGRPDLTEAGVSIVCYWIGRLEGAGVEVVINSSSVLNSTHRRGDYGWRQFYGYLKQPPILT